MPCEVVPLRVDFFKMAAVAIEMAKMLIGWTNFASLAMETKKGGFKIILDSFHQTS